MWRKGLGKIIICIVRGKFWNYLIRERVRERIVIVGLGDIVLLYKELEKE